MGSQADEVTTSRPDSVLTTLASASGIAILHDATAREDFRQLELKLIEHSESVPLDADCRLGGAAQTLETELRRVDAQSACTRNDSAAPGPE